MEARYYADSDYDTLAKWWTGHDWPAVEPTLLPVGFVVDGYAAGFIYVDELGIIAMMEWVVTNPDEPSGMARYKAIKLIIKACSEYAKERGAKLIYTTSNNEKLIKVYEKGGFMVTENATLMLKSLV